MAEKAKILIEQFDLRAERETLAACVQGDPFKVLGKVTAADFYDPANYHVMSAIIEMAQAGDVITFASVCNKLKINGKFTLPVENVVTEAFEYPKVDPEAAAQIVKDKSRLRTLRGIYVKHIETIDSGRAEPEKIVGLTISDCINVSTTSKNSSRHISDISGDVDVHVENITSGNLVSYSTGIAGVDLAIGGVQAGEMFGVTGPPGSCKSLVKNGMNLLNAKKVPVVSYILEMGVIQELIRACAIEGNGRVNAKKFRGGPGVEPPSIEEVEAFNEVKSRLAKLPLWMDNTKFGLMEILADAERRVQENGVKIVTIDYVQLIHAGDGGNRTGELERISQAFRMFAQKNNCAVVMVVRLDKAGASSSLKGNDLTGAELHGSSSFHYDFSSLVSLYFDKPMWLCKCDPEEQFTWDEDKESLVSIHTPGIKKYCHKCMQYVKQSDGRLGNAYVLKARDGETYTKVPLKLDGATLQITEVEFDEKPMEYAEAEIDSNYDFFNED